MSLNPLVLNDCRIYFDGADLTGYSNKVEADAMVDDLDVTTWASGGYKARVGGLFDSTVKMEGFFQASDLTQPDDATWADLGVNTTALTFLPTSTGAAGDLCYVNRVIEAQTTRQGTIGQVLKWTADTKGNWPVARGQILHPQGTARSSSGNGTGVQLGAVSATQALYVCLHVLSISGTGTPTITVTVQDSVDNTFASPHTTGTFSAATAVGGQTMRVAGAITNTWYRVTWTITGSTPSFLFAVGAGIAAK